VELEEQLGRFRERGFGLAALSYDSAAILKEFAARKRISFPLLADPDSKVIRTFGIQNEADYPPGHLAHGVPYPGTFVADGDGIVTAKHFEKAYAERRTASSLLTLAGETPEASAAESSTPAFTVRTSASNGRVAPGQRFTLVLDFEMKPTLHAYAPGVRGYRPLRLRLEPHPLATAHETAFPPSTSYRFAPLDETVPVFEGRFRVTQDVTLAGGREFDALLKEPAPVLELVGTLDYQVCSDKVCYPPASLMLRWVVTVVPLDRERSPEGIRHESSSRP
jgi:hypothetical protein